jgi:GNAT acetyltransferase-like protein
VRRLAGPVPTDIWQQVVDADPDTLVWQTPSFMRCLLSTGMYQDRSRLYETAAGRRLVLPMVRWRFLPRQLASEASLPLGWGVGGLIGTGGVRASDVAAIFTDLATDRVLRRTLIPNPRTAALWAAARPDAVVAFPRRAHVLRLEGGAENIWKTRFRSETRGAVRKAERAGLTVECDTTGRLVPAFLHLYRVSEQRWAGRPRQPAAHPSRQLRRVARFLSATRALGPARQIWMAWSGGRPAASIVVLQGVNASNTLGAMDKDLAGPTRANDLLHHLAIQDACRAGCNYYHMGETGTSHSLAVFKERFGAEPFDYAEYRMGRLPVSGLRQRLGRLIGH